jgi:hypothetical protein
VATDQLTRPLELVQRLGAAEIPYRLTSRRPNAICVEVVSPGVYWEIEFMQDGGIEVERYVSNGEIADESALEVLFQQFAD